MMLTTIQGDLFASQAQTLVNTVNCVGVMGKGIALEFKNRFPAMFRDYRDRCRRGEVRIGRPYLYKDSPDRWVLNFPTKIHWRAKSKMDFVVSGLEFLAGHYHEWGVASLAFPLLGANHGGLDKRLVQTIMTQHLSQFDIPVEIYIL